MARRQRNVAETVADQLNTHGIDFGDRMRDTSSGFTGKVVAFYFFEHGCMRVNLRGRNAMTGEAVEATFDAPELEHERTETPVPSGSRRGGPHGLTPVARR